MVMSTSISHAPAPRHRRSRARSALVLGMAGLLAAAGVTALSGPAEAASTLGASAAEKGRYFGAAVAAQQARRVRRTPPS